MTAKEFIRHDHQPMNHIVMAPPLNLEKTGQCPAASIISPENMNKYTFDE
jgi:hypothetical protein